MIERAIFCIIFFSNTETKLDCSVAPSCAGRTKRTLRYIRTGKNCPKVHTRRINREARLS
jgi:hypothetical protein